MARWHLSKGKGIDDVIGQSDAKEYLGSLRRASDANREKEAHAKYRQKILEKAVRKSKEQSQDLAL